MLAVLADRIVPDDPVSGLAVRDAPEPEAPEGWTTVEVRAASINHHDVWSLKGVGLREEQLPMILGTDAAGLDEDGRRIVVHGVIGDPEAGGGDETLDPRRSLLSERHPGTFAERVCVPRRNVVPLPGELSFEEGCCLPTAWLTAYRMLVSRSRLPAGGGGTVLIQGAGGGVATAALALAKALGHTVFVTSRSAERRERALADGADAALEPGERAPAKVDAVLDSVGEAVWEHSLRSLRPGGVLVTCGATSGQNPPASLNRIFFLQLSVVGSTMGTREELEALIAFLLETGLRPAIDSVLPFADAAVGIGKVAAGDVHGKVVLLPGG
jgi:NADPH:quinone reductase-like Zn-dependent oxidoreductase